MLVNHFHRSQRLGPSEHASLPHYIIEGTVDGDCQKQKHISWISYSHGSDSCAHPGCI